MESISIGIIAGLTTTFIVVILQKLWASAIEPWYEERIYKDAKIEGTWEGTFPNLDLKEVVTLKRSAHDIKGTIAIIEGPDKGQAYELNGTFKNLILTASYSSTDKRNLDRGSYTLILKKNGKVLEGYSSFYEDDGNEIVSDTCKWVRNDK